MFKKDILFLCKRNRTFFSSYAKSKEWKLQKPHESNYERLFVILQSPYSNKDYQSCVSIIDSLSCFISMNVITPVLLEVYDQMCCFRDPQLEDKMKMLRVLVLNEKQVLLGELYLPCLLKKPIKLDVFKSGIYTSFIKAYLNRICKFLFSVSLEQTEPTTLALLLKRATYNADAVSRILLPALNDIPQSLLTVHVMEIVLKQALLVTPPYSIHSERLLELMKNNKAITSASSLFSKSIAFENLAQLQSNRKYAKILQIGQECFQKWFGIPLLNNQYPQVGHCSFLPVELDPSFIKLVRITINALVLSEDISRLRGFLSQVGYLVQTKFLKAELLSLIATFPVENLRSTSMHVRVRVLRVFLEYCELFQINFLADPAVFDLFIQALALVENTRSLRENTCTMQTRLGTTNKTDKKTPSDIDQTGTQKLLFMGEELSIEFLLDYAPFVKLILKTSPQRQSIIRALVYQAVPSAKERPYMGIEKLLFVLTKHNASKDKQEEDSWIIKFQNHLSAIKEDSAAQLLNYYGREEAFPTPNATYSMSRIQRQNAYMDGIAVALGIPSTIDISSVIEQHGPPFMLWSVFFSCFTKVSMIRKGFHAATCQLYHEFNNFIKEKDLYFHSFAVILCSFLMEYDFGKGFEVCQKWLDGRAYQRRQTEISRSFHPRHVHDMGMIDEYIRLRPLWVEHDREMKRRTNGRSMPINSEPSYYLLEILSIINISVKRDSFLFLSKMCEQHSKVGDIRREANTLFKNITKRKKKEICNILSDQKMMGMDYVLTDNEAGGNLKNKDNHIEKNSSSEEYREDEEVVRLLYLLLAVPQELVTFRHKFYHYLFQRKEMHIDYLSKQKEQATDIE